MRQKGEPAEELAGRIEPWLRPEHALAYAAALEWLLPRCRTEEERRLAPALLLLLAPLNGLVATTRLAEGSRLSFQVTLSRPGPARVRMAVRAAAPDGETGRPEGETATDAAETSLPALWLDAGEVLQHPLRSAARVLEALLG